MKVPFLLLAALCLGMAGCASYHIQPIPSSEVEGWNKGKLDEGYVFYQPELYFLVTPSASTGKTDGASAADKGAPNGSSAGDKAGGFTVTPIYLPNPAKAYRVTTFNFLAKSDFAFNFKDGWQITSISDKADNSTIANTIAGELKTLLSASGLPGVGLMKGPPTPVQSFLLHPKYKPNGIIDGFDVVTLPKMPKTDE